MDDNNKIIQDKFEVLKNIVLDDQGSLRAKELHQIIKAQMDLTTSLFEQQHKDIKQIEKSSKRLEKLTYGLIILTGALVGLTIYLIYIT